jgi:dihydrofolate reductase
MGKVVASVFVTLDNLMVGENEDMSWVLDNFGADMGNDMDEVMGSMQAILLGRVTYDIMANSWPSRTEAEDPGADHMNHTPKIVFSKTLEQAPWGEWGNATVVRSILPEEIQHMKGRSDQNLVIMGSASIVQQFTNLGLIDEYRLWLFPVVLGRGKPLFKDINDRHDLRLVEAKTYESGAMALTLQRKE